MKLRRQAVRMMSFLIATIGAGIVGCILFGSVGCVTAMLLAAYCRYFRMPELECEQNFPSEAPRLTTLAMMLYVAAFFIATVIGTSGLSHGYSAPTVAIAERAAQLMTVGFVSSLVAILLGDLSTKHIRWTWK